MPPQPFLSRETTRRPSCRKALEPLPPAGDLHAAFLAWCDLDPEVATIARNDVDLDLSAGAHRPAYALTTVDGARVLADVVATPAELPATETTLADAAGTAGFGYRLETARSLRAEPRATTVSLVAAARGVPVPAGDRVRLLAALDEAGTLPLVEAAAAVRSCPDGVCAVLALACEGVVVVDVEAPLAPETAVRRAPASTR